MTKELYSPSNNNRGAETSINYDRLKEVKDLEIEGNKATKQSWRDRIKGIANNVEDWR